MMLRDFFSWTDMENADQNEIMPISFSVHEVLNEK